MIEILFALVFAGSGDVDCSIFNDGIRTHEEVLEICAEFEEDYNWEPPPYEDDYPHDCLAYWLYEPWTTWEEMGAICLAGYASEGGSGSSYEVQAGDLSLWSISQKYGIPFGALLDANPSNPDLIRVGDRINLP